MANKPKASVRARTTIKVEQADESLGSRPLTEVACFTSFTFSYLGKARLLAWSLKRFHPDWHMVAVITDRPPTGYVFNPSTEPFDEIIWGQSLEIESVISWIYKHSIVEVCTAVKGHVLKQLAEAGFKKVVYLDPDIAVFNSLQPVIDLLDTHSVVLTPHQLTPESMPMAVRDNEIGSLKHGIFNLGFVAIRGDGEGLRFAKWWSDRLLEYCYDDIPNGLFTDQRWCDHVPVFFDRVHILKDPGYNVASWNLSNRLLTVDSSGQLQANGAPLRFYHVTKFGPVGETMTSRYATDNTVVYEVWCWYRNTLKRFEEPSIPKNWWAYGQYSSGNPISAEERKLYRVRVDLQRSFPDPFDSRNDGGYEGWYKAQQIGSVAS